MTYSDDSLHADAGEIERLNRELERRVAERTAQLEIANRELEAFSYSVAHDLRAPLRLIHAHVQMLREYRGAPDAREPQIHLAQIQRGAREMSSLIDGLLALSSVSHVQMNYYPVALGDLLDHCVQQLMTESQGRDIHWRIGELPQVEGDADLLQQVFMNLLSNALKYSRPRPQAVITVSVETAAPGEQAQVERCIVVQDNGIGFDMAHAGKLFGVFQRLHRQDEFEGTGVGLATVRRIIERHGGRIWAQSTPGEGACFRFTLAGL